MGSQTITIPAADSPTGANLTLTWVADVSASDGESYGPGYTNVSNLSLNDYPSGSTIAVWILPAMTANASGFYGTDEVRERYVNRIFFL